MVASNVIRGSVLEFLSATEWQKIMINKFEIIISREQQMVGRGKGEEHYVIYLLMLPLTATGRQVISVAGFFTFREINVANLDKSSVFFCS